MSKEQTEEIVEEIQNFLDRKTDYTAKVSG
jgi:hypothetical protein